MPDTGLPPLAFSACPLDRGEAVRRDATTLAALQADPAGRRIVLRGGEPLISHNGQLIRFPLNDPRFAPDRELIFLGFEDGTALFAGETADSSDPFEDSRFSDPRAAGMRLEMGEAGIFAFARSLLLWRERRSFCSSCGDRLKDGCGGLKRDCIACGAEHFPRTDPVVIMLPVDGDRCLLGRQAAWPPRMWSALAGFMEPGETIEEACARETAEETGIKVDHARAEYIASQPWPFPSSLMIGLIVPAISRDVTIDTAELETARWFTKAEIAAMLAGEHPDADVPPKIAIARRLLEVWAAR
ncbi:NAD(+) diphosphatase [Hyphobacterium sp. SN044]|uniref:NAD(+) diphosphatase n=1 Tax=Hyphobacterium sp. SN044 TaxID=2912575 RepID=UPI001F013B9D|nr:NAD(+) diphosphatase [Hyphobacterium sp. SN044]MCF8879616.1 NAD(+) diphosphatase [Hyphobacterium sp. SN044]